MAQKESPDDGEVHRSTTTTSSQSHEQYSDPGEDDLDDLDGMSLSI